MSVLVQRTAPRVCPRIFHLTSASSRKPMVVALSNSTYYNSGTVQPSCRRPWSQGGQRGPTKTHSCSAGFIHFYFLLYFLARVLLHSSGWPGTYINPVWCCPVSAMLKTRPSTSCSAGKRSTNGATPQPFLFIYCLFSVWVF